MSNLKDDDDLAIVKANRQLVHYVEREWLTDPRDGHALVHRWWVHFPGRGVVMYGSPRRGWSPQCNSDVRIVWKLIDSLYQGAEAIKIPVAYLGKFGPRCD